jgi:hypothetical protein
VAPSTGLSIIQHLKQENDKVLNKETPADVLIRRFSWNFQCDSRLISFQSVSRYSDFVTLGKYVLKHGSLKCLSLIKSTFSVEFLLNLGKLMNKKGAVKTVPIFLKKKSK